MESLEGRLVLAGWSPQAELFPAAPPLNAFFTNGDLLGQSVAIDGDTAVVGASGDDTGAGSAYVFKRTGTTWTATQRLVAPDRANNDNFGFSVGISGNIIVVGSPADNASRGSIYIFERSTPATDFTNPLAGPHFSGTAGDSFVRFGNSVAIDGGVIVVGAPDDDNAPGDNAGSIQIFTRSAIHNWNASVKYRSSDIAGADEFGHAVSIRGDTIAVGARFADLPAKSNAGAVYVFERMGGTTLIQQQKLTAADSAGGDRFGSSVAIDGGTIAVGAPFADVAVPGSGTDEGAAYVFAFGGSTWTQQAKLMRTSSAPGGRAANPGDADGTSVAVEGDLIAVGATKYDDHNADDGAAFVYSRSGTTWSLDDTILSTDPGTGGDLFGGAVAVDGGAIVVGAAQHDHAGKVNSGGAYVFVDPNDPPVNSVPGPQAINEGGTLTFSAGNLNAISISDVDAFGADLRVTLTASNGTLTLGGTTGLVFSVGTGTNDTTMTFDGTIAEINAALEGTVFTPTDADYFGPASVSILTNDLGNTGTGGPQTDSDSVSITVNPVNDAPTLATAADHTSSEDAGPQSVAGFATASPGPANESAQTLTYNILSNTNAALFAVQPAIAPNGTLTYEAAADANGSATITVEVMDNGGIANGGVDTSSPAVFTITVNAVNDDPTVANAIADVTVAEDAADTVLDLSATFADVDIATNADSLTLSVTGNSNAGLVSTAIVGNTLTLSYAANQNGSSTITVRATDLAGAFVETAFLVTVNAVNDVPTVANAIADVTVTEDAADTVLDLSATFADVDIATNADSLTLSVTGNSNAGLVSAAIVGNTLTLSYAANQNGSSTITVRATDLAGAFVETAFLVTVNAVNDDPTVANAIADVTVAEDAADTVLDLSATFADVDIATNADSLTLSVAGNSNAALVSTALVGNMLTLSYAANQNGSSTITVRATDLAGAYVETAFLVTVNAVNDDPIANNQTTSVTEDGQVSITLGGSDVETAEANLVFTITSLPATGVLTYGGSPVAINDTFTGPPTLVYEPAVGSGAASASFTFTVTDDGDDSAAGQADATSAPATVSINITASVPDGTAVLSGGILRVGGTGGSDTLVVDRIGSTVRVTINGVDTNFPAGSVTEIRVFGRAGNDLIVIDPPIALDTLIDAGSGNDIVYGGGGRDLVFGGDGLDMLFGNGGNDMLIGGAGSDLLVGGAGHDVLVAGSVAANYTAAMLRDVAAAWAADRTAEEGQDDGTLDESAADDDFDILSGGAGADWFIINLGDWVIDYRPRGANGDHITYV